MTELQKNDPRNHDGEKYAGKPRDFPNDGDRWIIEAWDDGADAARTSLLGPWGNSVTIALERLREVQAHGCHLGRKYDNYDLVRLEYSVHVRRTTFSPEEAAAL